MIRLFHKELEAYLVAEGLFDEDITEDGQWSLLSETDLGGLTEGFCFIIQLGCQWSVLLDTDLGGFNRGVLFHYSVTNVSVFCYQKQI